MTWMKVETLVRSNPKLVATVAATGHCDAAWLWLAANTWARDSLTDGFIPEMVLPTLIPALPAKVLKGLPAVLVKCGLWHVAENGYQVHDFLQHNPTKAEVTAKRRKDAERKRDGVGTDSTRNPYGVQLDSASHAGERADAHLSSHSSSALVDDPVSTKNPEGGLGETTPRLHRIGVVDRARALGIEQPGQWDRQHASHALRADFCSSFVCLPIAVHAEFVTRVVSAGSSQAEAEASVRAWALDVKARWAGEIPGEDSFKFWRAEWAATHPARRVSTTAAPGAGLDALITAASAGKAVARG
jgi:hypothetical protein